MSRSIAELTTAMAAGESAAIEAFYRERFEVMLLMAKSASRGRDEAFVMDVVHDAMLRIVRCVRPMETESHLLGWLRLVVQSCAIDRLRAEQRRRQREREVVTHGGDDMQEQIEWLQLQISRLDPQLADLFRLRFGEGWTLTRIASAFRTTTGQIDGQLRRAIARLQKEAKVAFDD